jgi:Tfp pilus assembly protein PilV
VKTAGFSLIEVLFATTIVMAVVGSLAQLVVLSADANQIARDSSIALLLAEQKMEDLRGTPAGLALSPPDTLTADTAGYVDYFDAEGVRLADSDRSASPGGAVFVRRWSVDSLAAGAGNLVALHVMVTQSSASRGRGRNATRLVGVRTQ